MAKKSGKQSASSRQLNSSRGDADRIVVDSIHGAIKLTEIEWRVIDTASFQRLRHLKQLGLGHVTYPNATHTRFAHSLGVLAVMSRVLDAADGQFNLKKTTRQDMRLAALLHDIGHYPYSHLMERVDGVTLTEERVRASKSRTIDLLEHDPYPDHEQLGRLIVTGQKDIVEALGGKERAHRISDIFTRSNTANPQLSKLIHSSLDMDRLDYLVRDARATGVPYGEIDINYLLNNVRISSTGMVGVDYKALTAAEQFLFARYFIHKTVYYHKTTFALEEAFRQLIKRCRDKEKYGLPRTGASLEKLVRQPLFLHGFTDQYLDNIAREATTDGSKIISRLAKAIVYRKPPKLLRQECMLVDHTDSEALAINRCANFTKACEKNLAEFARKSKISLGLFLLANLKPVRLEERGQRLSPKEAVNQPSEVEDELIKVFGPGEPEPESLVDYKESLISVCGHLGCHMTRLYVLEDDPKVVEKLRKAVKAW